MGSVAGSPPWVDRLDFDDGGSRGFRPCTTVYYVVDAVDRLSKTSPTSAEAPLPTPCWGPRAPTGLTARPGERRVFLDWDDRDVPELVGYDVYRGDIEADTTFTLRPVHGVVPDLPAECLALR